jgi:predicted DNA-binding ribbon-helix-helix protein
VTPKYAKSANRKRSVRVGKHMTGITIEDKFWHCLKEIAHVEQLPLSNLLADINRRGAHGNLSSAVRLYVLDHYRRLSEKAASPAKGKR